MNNLKYSNGSTTYVESLEKKIAELEKQIVAIDMNNEPVAWIEPITESVMKDYDYQNNLFANETGDWIPLYTHPVNPYQSITNTKIEPTVVSYTHPVKELDEDFDAICLENKRLQAEIEKLRSWVEMLVEVPFFNEIDHYRGIPVAILRKADKK